MNDYMRQLLSYLQSRTEAHAVGLFETLLLEGSCLNSCKDHEEYLATFSGGCMCWSVSSRCITGLLIMARSVLLAEDISC